MGFFGRLIGKEGFGGIIDPFDIGHGDIIGGGGAETPSLQLPKVGTSFGEALEFGRSELPFATGARESALADIATPEATTQFFGGFGPTGFEESLLQSPFQNILTQVERRAKNIASLSGLPETAGAQFAQGISPTLLNLGQMLAQLQQRRGETSLQARLGIDPLQATRAESFLSQGNLQASADFQRQVEEANQKNAMLTSLLSLAGGVGGFAIGGPGGAGIGAALGGQAGSLFGGSQAPVDLGQAFQFAQGNQQNDLLQQLLNRGGTGGVQRVDLSRPNLSGFNTSLFPAG